MTPSETVLIRSLLWASAGVAAAIPALVLPPAEDPVIPIVVHLSLASLFVVGLGLHLAPLGDPPWFDGTLMSLGARRGLTGLVLVATVTASLLPPLFATGVAQRYEPSMQYFLVGTGLVLGLLSMLTFVGLRNRFGGGVAVVGAVVISTVCIVAAGRYLSATGGGPDGSLIASGIEFGRMVLRWWAVVATLAVLAFSYGATD